MPAAWPAAPEVPADGSAVPGELPAAPPVAEESGEASVEKGDQEVVALPSPVAAPVSVPPAVPLAHKYDPNTAFLIEFLAGFFGLLGIGYLYAGRGNDGVVRLVAWLVYNVIVWTTIVVLSLALVGLFCIPFQLVLQVGVPLWSANTLKKQLLADA
jgi:TM2 domain-containing membrane protein YozV